MRIRIKVFSYLKDIVGSDQIVIEVNEPITVKNLVNELVRKWPELSKIEDNFLIILKNGIPAKFDEIVSEEDELAILPPVSGG